MDEDIGDLFTCIGFDPGGTTGWGLVSCHWEAMELPGYRILDNIVFWACGQFTGPLAEQANEMMALVNAWPRNTAIVVEDFLLRQFRMDRTLLDPIRVTERFAQLLHNTEKSYLLRVARENGGGAGVGGVVGCAPRTIVLQQPAMAMTTMTDGRLKLAEESLAAALGAGAGGAAGGARGVGGRGYGFFSATAGRPHARDAMRHVFTFMRRERAARMGSGGVKGTRHSLYDTTWRPAPAGHEA